MLVVIKHYNNNRNVATRVLQQVLYSDNMMLNITLNARVKGKNKNV